MKTIKIQSLFSFLMIAAVLFFSACSEDEPSISLTEQEKSDYESEQAAENLFDAVESITNSAAQYNASSGGRIAQSEDKEIACAEISIIENQLTINFGEEGCVGPDGKTRKGKVIVIFEGTWLTTDFIITTTLKDFYIDDVKVEGTRYEMNKGFNQETSTWTNEVKIKEGKVIWPNETFATRESVRTHEFSFNTETKEFELTVEGEAAGTNVLGDYYESNITEPLVFRSSCLLEGKYLPSSGTSKITFPENEEKSDVSINFGSGDCDNKFVVEVERGSVEVEM